MKEQALALVRHALTFAGGLVVGKGYVDEATATAVVGALMTLISVAWSALDKAPRKE